MIRLHPARGGGTNWTGHRLARSPLSSLELVIDEGSSIRSQPMGLQDPNRLLRRSGFGTTLHAGTFLRPTQPVRALAAPATRP